MNKKAPVAVKTRRDSFSRNLISIYQMQQLIYPSMGCCYCYFFHTHSYPCCCDYRAGARDCDS